jgi:hypothetical protein
MGMAGDVYPVGHHWRLRGSIDDVYGRLSRPKQYPDWWPAIPSVDILKGEDEPAVGDSVRMHVQSFLPYQVNWVMTTTHLDPPTFVNTENTVILGGRLRLTGPTTVRLRQDGDYVDVVQRETLSADGWHLPLLLRWVAYALFSFNHAYAALGGRRGLQLLLDEAPMRDSSDSRVR